MGLTPKRRNERIITATEVQSAAYSGAEEITYDASNTIVTPLARERANDLGIRLAPTSRSARSPRAVGASIEPDRKPLIMEEIKRRLDRRIGG